MPFQQAQFRLLLFDVGGVLVELSGLSMLLSWLENRLTAEQIITLWLSSPTVRLFETGNMAAETFADRLIRELNLPVGREEFLNEFCTWSQTALPGAVELVKRIPRTYIRATLCNTNAVQWPYLVKNQDLLGSFDHHFASHLTGKIKPDEEAFRNVLAKLRCTPCETLFLDDSRLNVAAAKKLGITAIQVNGPAEAERALHEAAILLD